MTFFEEMGQLALGSRFKALSDTLYGLADQVYQGRGSQLRGRWFPLVRLLHDRGPLSVGEIAREIAQTHSAVSQLADKLVREGWLQTLTDAQDERRRLLALTEKAQSAIREVKPLWKSIREVLLERCAAADIDLLGALQRFERLLEAPDLTQSILERATHTDSANLRIVPYSPELSAHFYRLNEQWLRKFFYVEEVDHRVLANPQGEILDAGGAILFAVLGETVVGTCALKPEKPDHYELTKMAVDEGHQGLGIGRRLLAAAIEEFQGRKGKVLFLETSTKLEPALHLYESFGFKRQASLKPGSSYQRADVYMIWQPSGTKKAQPKTSQARARSRGGRDKSFTPNG